MSNEAIGKESKEAKQGKGRKHANPTLPPSAASMAAVAMPHHRIPRPPNAFMIFANEHRKLLAKKFPRESNKEISCRLGKMWRALSDDIKGKYHGQAKILDMEHKKKYPDYVYNPRDARLRKEARRQRIIAGNNLAKAMSHHIMVKQAKNNMLNLNQQRMPGPIPCLVNQNKITIQLKPPPIHFTPIQKGNIEDQMKQAEKLAIREQVLRGLGLEPDKRSIGYFINTQNQQSMNGFQTFLPSMPVHLIQPCHGPSATMTSATNSFCNAFPTSTATSASSTETTITTTQSNDPKEQLRSVVSKLVSDNSERPREAVTVQFVNPTSQESIPKNPLLTLADEAVSKLSETVEEKLEEIQGEEIAIEGNGEPQECVSEIKTEIDEREEMMQPLLLEQRDKLSQKTAPMQMWMAKADGSVRVTRPMPLYFMQGNQPGLIGMRPSMCIQYAGNSGMQQLENQNGNGGGINVSSSSTRGISIHQGNHPSAFNRQAAIWETNMDPIMANNSIYSGNAYGNNYGNSVMPWSGGHVFYVPMQELPYNPTFSYGNPYQTSVSYPPNFKTSAAGSMVKAGEDMSNLTFAISEENGSGDGPEATGGGKNFGQILTTTMQILSEEQAEQDGKGLDPICHVNYEMVEKESSPSRQLADLTTASQTTAVFY